MILSRANLLPISIVKKQGDSRLNTLHIAKDGTTVAMNSRSLLAVSPVKREVKQNLKFYAENRITESEGGTVTSETVKNVLKYMPKDTVFNGLLEHCDFNAGKFDINDGKRWHSIAGKLFDRKYVKYIDVFRKIGASKNNTKLTINLKTLLETLTVIDKASQNTTTENPLYMEITKEGHLLLRSENFRTGQRILGITSAYKEDETKWLDLNLWERKMLGRLKGLVRKVIPKRK